MSVTWTRGMVVAAVIVASACGGSGGSGASLPTSPGTSSAGPALDPGCPPSTSRPNCAPANVATVLIRIFSNNPIGDTPFSYSIGNLTVSGTGTQYARIIGIPPGTVEVSGQFQSGNRFFTIGIPETNAGGSIPLGTIQNVEGPLDPQGVTDCQVFYFTSGSTPINFRFRFTLNAAGAQSSCRF